MTIIANDLRMYYQLNAFWLCPSQLAVKICRGAIAKILAMPYNLSEEKLNFNIIILLITSVEYTLLNKATIFQHSFKVGILEVMNGNNKR